jgi:hypothetical protein
MNVILDPLKALWQRKLWPVAVLLVAALVAVPKVLAKNPEVTPTPANAQAAKAEAGLPATYVAAAQDSAEPTRRRVLGESKDPFTPAGLSKAAKAARAKVKAKAAKEAAKAKAEAAKAASNATSTDSGSSAGGDTGSGAGPGTTTTAPPAGEAPKTTTYPLYSIKVRFGRVDGERTAKTVARMKVLPNTDSPLLVYRGVEDGGKVAVFELTGSVTALGDGKCEPSPQDCQILKLKAGETEFLTVSDTGAETDAQYQLDLDRINVKQTTTKSELTKAGSAGLALLKHLAADRKPSYVFSTETGTLHKVARRSKLTKSAQRSSL